MRLKCRELRYMSGDKYSSTSAKTISQGREWYVDQVLYQINEQYGGAAGMINDKINEEFGDSANDVREANKDGADLLKEAISFPIGLTMMAQHVQDDGTKYGVDELGYWDEEVTLGVDMEPDYLYEKSDDGKKLINLGVQNVCFFGPTGIPVLPQPNYMVQFNSWMINVEGRMNEFTLIDADNEVHPNPVFGHEAQIYKRKIETVYDTATNLPIGLNQPIKFKFDTGTFIAVPPFGKSIGDRDGYNNPELIFGETSSEYGKL